MVEFFGCSVKSIGDPGLTIQVGPGAFQTRLAQCARRPIGMCDEPNVPRARLSGTAVDNSAVAVCKVF